MQRWGRRWRDNATSPPSLPSLRGGTRACLAEAGEASEGWWSQAGSNRRPLACHASALPAELWPLKPAAPWATRAANPEHSSESSSSLLVAADIADNVGDVFIAFLFVGDKGRIVIVVVFDGLVDLDVVFRFRNDGFDLAGIFFGVGFLERHQLLSLDRLRSCFGSRSGRRSIGACCGIGAGSRRRYRRNRYDLAGVG